MKASLQLKLSQSLNLTPQLQQAIKLLQLSTVEMNQELERYLEENPLLEREDEPPETPPSTPPAFAENRPAETAAETPPAREEPATSDSDFSGGNDAEWGDEGGAYGSPKRERGEDEEVEAQDLQAVPTTLRDHLLEQVRLSRFSEREQGLIRFLIGDLDESGYLSSTFDELWEALPKEAGLAWAESFERTDLDIALRQLQSFDPAGVGARSPAECLALQLRAQPRDFDRDWALVIVERHLPLLAARDFARLKRETGADDDTLRRARKRILALDPHPGARFAPLSTQYILPDVIVKKIQGQWQAHINPDAYPKLRVNRLYADILSRQRRGEGNLSAQLQEARWLIKNVQQRFDTILRTSQAIVERQRAFFEHGEVAMRPLVLREIAEAVELHESTISRVTTQKYMSTPRGIFELKYFFGSHVATDTGGACSSTAIRAMIRKMIGEESSSKPLSDGKISEILAQQGIVVARRTVAKYREALGILPVSQRKAL
ncbi:MAG: RNA polymerase factor sigma-54 [Zoogloeaceae bacterium]|jgi:RNA polymerase sigma-54 factor|nr:RNA polymerase factor sigma-54 [Zoogloeaceae bacterium]